MTAVDFSSAARAKARPRLSKADRRMIWRGLMFAAPASLLLLAIYIVPMLVLAGFSVTDYQLGSLSTRFVGLGNFVKAFQDPVFLRALANTAIYALIVIPFGVFLALGVALLVYNRKRSRAFWEVAYFLPVTATLVAMATVWQFLLHPSLGPVNAAIKWLGLEPVAFLSNPVLLIPTMALMGVWQILGFNMVLFLAGLTAISKDLHEAARLDGAKNPVDRFLTVTWPMLGPTTMFVVVTTSISAFKVFETVAVLTKGRFGSETLLFDLYLEGFEYSNTGYAAALTIIFLAIVLVLSIGQTLHMDRKVHY
ncbi:MULTISPECIES: carbohydrate ABC transporter permease [Agrobacterium]|jgi:multiple sugar transport system permease protein|uniref:Multiple sugar transport system permease protein n=4 Tax=Agrobacterium tumefaciens complex TaxID=1183400 RepID=A0AAP5DDB1_AGRTU|nr:MULTISPECIES: sugar ABC transporter permease [Agrobacterium]MCP2133010.1 multiple sugar transport system permease protein [Rhizobium sp. SLBN-94]TGE81820.1 sugar ABC transporter permease [Rhizobium sp. SEMIA 439]AYM04309.1 multiple sugar transport system permease protein [Agrobacterium tumefaciens]AYM79954.1 multiple sugar transport system permease protein [Agrobacterium tumefaciens]EHH08184.1 ABC transporter transmembrane protein [Agrobacterium tumefaciens CCNWGS0286]